MSGFIFWALLYSAASLIGTWLVFLRQPPYLRYPLNILGAVIMLGLVLAPMSAIFFAQYAGGIWRGCDIYCVFGDLEGLRGDLRRFGVDQDTITTEGFRALIGMLFGLLFGYLLYRWSHPHPSPTGGGPAGAWTRDTAVLPVILAGAFAYALLAPRGELSFDFIRSLKIASIEAEFTQNHTDLRFEIESEPQGFFQVDRTGMGEALDMARAELFLRESLAPDAAETETFRAAFDFMRSVLQPVVLCAQQIDALYGDQEFLRGAFQAWGAALVRAIVLVQEGQTDEARLTLMRVPDGLVRQRQRQMSVLEATSGSEKPYRVNLCLRGADAQSAGRWVGDPGAALGRYTPEELAVVLKEPATAHAASMFFLWSGNPRAADRLLGRVRASEGEDGLPVYPGIPFVRGFTDRWLNTAATDVERYLDRWQTAIDSIETRLRLMASASPDQLGEIAGVAEPVAIFGPVTGSETRSETKPEPGTKARSGTETEPEAPGARLPIEGCEAPEPAVCRARLAYGYYTYFLVKTRNHLVFEAARELMTGRNLPDRDRILELALRSAAALHRVVETNALRVGHGITQQMTLVAAGGESPDDAVKVTIDMPERFYALLLDSVGLIRLAKAVRDSDDSEAEVAQEMFNQALTVGAGLLGEGIERTIREHRSQARQALGQND